MKCLHQSRKDSVLQLRFQPSPPSASGCVFEGTMLEVEHVSSRLLPLFFCLLSGSSRHRASIEPQSSLWLIKGIDKTCWHRPLPSIILTSWFKDLQVRSWGATDLTIAAARFQTAVSNHADTQDSLSFSRNVWRKHYATARFHHQKLSGSSYVSLIVLCSISFTNEPKKKT